MDDKAEAEQKITLSKYHKIFPNAHYAQYGSVCHAYIDSEQIECVRNVDCFLPFRSPMILMQKPD